MKKFFLTLFVGMLSVSLTATPSQAGELDILLDKLVDKGIVTPIEASIIKDETKQLVAGEVGEGKSYAVPAWVQKMKLKGDIRLRWQKEVRDSDVVHRNRGRVRYRLGIIAQPHKDIEVGGQLASGSSDPRSTNDTFDDTFSSKGVNLDKAYAKWTPKKGVKIIGGKFGRKEFLWQPTDLLWDGDINPEGFSVNLTKGLSKRNKGFLNFGLWVLDDRDQAQADLSSPYMYYAQVGNKWKKGDYDAKLAGTIYKFQNIEGNTLDNAESTNTRVAGLFTNEYNSKGIEGEFGIKDPLGLGEYGIKRFAVFGQFVKNFDISKDNIGWATGFKFGHKKVKKPGNWQFKYIYAELQKDAWLDAFPDSDRYGGKTDIKSHEAVVKYALKKNVILGLDVYKSQRLDNGKNKELLSQLDLVIKF